MGHSGPRVRAGPCRGASSFTGLIPGSRGGQVPLLQCIQPRTAIVEEAAEILEAHILTCLTASCRHLILIGDHHQPTPKLASYTLEKKHRLGISLRMINNEIPHVEPVPGEPDPPRGHRHPPRAGELPPRLEPPLCPRQHRMRPEISQLLVPIFYKALKDHPAVGSYEGIKVGGRPPQGGRDGGTGPLTPVCPPGQGVKSSVFFIQHAGAEDLSGHAGSYSSRSEAAFLVHLCEYLLEQGYAAGQLTILTPYSGQVATIRQLLAKRDMAKVAVCTVDDFQGEESDIVLLSLVRSKPEERTASSGTGAASAWLSPTPERASTASATWRASRRPLAASYGLRSWPPWRQRVWWGTSWC
ncbi:LOW QUALITY PROTEIN: NFX1-type zinc finger-containing protein 1-like [Theristicus caerulescens]